MTVFPVFSRFSSKPNGTMNGDIYNHLDQELDILNSGKLRVVNQLVENTVNKLEKFGAELPVQF